MRAFGILLILLACLMFTLAFLTPEEAGEGSLGVELSLLASALMMSGSVFASAGALGQRLASAPSSGRSEDKGALELEACTPAAPAEPAIRRPGFHRRAA